MQYRNYLLFIILILATAGCGMVSVEFNRPGSGSQPIPTVEIPPELLTPQVQGVPQGNQEQAGVPQARPTTAVDLFGSADSETDSMEESGEMMEETDDSMAEPTAMPEPTPVPTRPPDLMREAVRYRDPEVGISFDHPDDWIIDSTIDNAISAGRERDVATLMETGSASMPAVQITVEEAAGRTAIAAISAETETAGANLVVEPFETATDSREAAHAEVTGEAYTVYHAIVDGEWLYMLRFTAATEQGATVRKLADDLLRSVAISGIQTEEIVVETEQGAELEEAKFAGEIKLNSVVTGTIGTEVTYTMTVEAVPDYLIAATSNTADLTLTIRDEAGNILTQSDERFSAEPESLIFDPTEDGTYFIELKNIALTGGDVMLALYEAEQVRNDAPEFEVEEGTIPLIHIEAADNFDPRIEVFNQYGQPVTKRDRGLAGATEFLTLPDLELEPYQLTIDSFNGQTGTYTTTVVLADDLFYVGGRTEEGGSISAMSVGTVASGNTGLDGHLVALDGNTTYLIVAGGTIDADVIVKLYDGNREEVFRHDLYGTGEMEAAPVNVPTGEYLLAIEEWHSDRRLYAVGIFEYEPLLDSQVDVKVAPDLAPVIVAIPVEDFDVVISVNDDTGVRIEERDQGFDGTTEVLLLRPGALVNTGTYTVFGTGFNGTDGPYELAVAYVDRTFMDVTR